MPNNELEIGASYEVLQRYTCKNRVTKAKMIEGRNNLASHVKRVIDFVLCGDKLPKEIKIESSPFVIPLTLNVDYFLDIESENTILKAKIAELSK